MTGNEGINLRLWMQRAMLCAKISQSCPTLCNFMDYSPPKSSVQGALQARILNGLPYLPPGYLPNPGVEPKSLTSPALAGEFLTTSATLRKGNKKTILYMIASKRTKYLGINLAKETKDFCTEYCKILLKEIKDINK